MSQKNYKVNEAIEVIYQAAGAKTGLTINMETYDEAHTLVAGGPTVLTEFGVTGRYWGSFTPDAEGDWSVQVEEAGGKGQVVKHYSVGSYNLHEVGSDVAAADAKIVTLDGKIDNLDADIVAIDTKIDDLASPPIIS